MLKIQPPFVAYTDKGCFQEWKMVADTLNKSGFNIVLSKVVEENAREEGEDIADVFLKYKTKKKSVANSLPIKLDWRLRIKNKTIEEVSDYRGNFV